MRRVLILGSTGHLGGLVLESCKSRGDLDAHGASRTAEDASLRVDLGQPGSFAGLAAFDVVVNAADTSRVCPVPLAQFCMGQGMVYLETTADARVFERLLSIDSTGPGTVVLGAGTFPGLSTTLLGFVHGESDLEFRARWSVLSGAGPGTVEVMVDALEEPVLRVERGAPIYDPPLSPVLIREVQGRPRACIPLSAPDVLLATARGDGRSARFMASVRPSMPRPMLRCVAWAARKGVFGWPPVSFMTRLTLRLGRTLLLRKATTSLSIELYSEGRRVGGLTCDDAFQTGAAHIAALAARWPAHLTGTRLPHEGLSSVEASDEIPGLQFTEDAT